MDLPPRLPRRRPRDMMRKKRTMPPMAILAIKDLETSREVAGLAGRVEAEICLRYSKLSISLL